MRINPIKLNGNYNINKGGSWLFRLYFNHSIDKKSDSPYWSASSISFRIVLKKVNNANKSN